MNQPWVVDFYSDEGWESTMKSEVEILGIEEYSLYDKLRDESLGD